MATTAAIIAQPELLPNRDISHHKVVHVLVESSCAEAKERIRLDRTRLVQKAVRDSECVGTYPVNRSDQTTFGTEKH